MGLLLEKYTPEQIAEVIDAVMTMRPVTLQPVTPHPATAAANSVRKKRSKKPTVLKAAQRSTGVSAASAKSIAPSRPLNSWMAFRSRLNKDHAAL